MSDFIFSAKASAGHQTGTDALSKWPATIAGRRYRASLHQPDCEAIAQRMDRLYDEAPLEPFERAAILVLYSVELNRDAIKLGHYKAKDIDAWALGSVNSPWAEPAIPLTADPVARISDRVRRVASYVLYLEERYLFGPPADGVPEALPSNSVPAVVDEIVFCARTGKAIVANAGRPLMATAAVSPSQAIAVDPVTLAIKSSATFKDIDAWAKEEQAMISSGTFERSVDHEPEPI